MTQDSSNIESNEHSVPKRAEHRRHYLAELIVKLRPLLKSVAREHAQSVPDCKEDDSDIVQRSTVKAIEHVDQFQGKTNGQWRAWLISIVRNQALDVRRFWSQERRAHTQEENDSQIVRGLVDKSAATPNKSLEDFETNARLDEAIASLTIEHQQMIRWRMFHFMTYREMADRLKINETMARRRCENAMDALKKAWAELGSGSSA